MSTDQVELNNLVRSCCGKRTRNVMDHLYSYDIFTLSQLARSPPSVVMDVIDLSALCSHKRNALLNGLEVL